jgi:sugar phosphate permease
MSFDEHSIPRLKVAIAENKTEKSLIEVFEEENEISTGTSTPASTSRHTSGESSLHSRSGPEWQVQPMGYWTYALTYFGQFCVYLVRKPVLTAKPYIREEFNICSKFTLSMIDNCHLIPFSLFSMLFPNMVDKVGGKNTIGIAYAGAGLFIGLCWFTQFMKNSSVDFGVLCLFIFFSGCFQAFVWSGAIKVQQETMPLAPRKAYFPFWVTCCYIGSSVSGILIGAIYYWLGVPQDQGMEEKVITDFISHENCSIPQVLYVEKPVWNGTLQGYDQNVSGENIEELKVIDWRFTFLAPALGPMIVGFLAITTIPYPGKKSLLQKMMNPKKDPETEDEPLLEADNQSPLDLEENDPEEEAAILQSNKQCVVLPMSQVLREVPGVWQLSLAGFTAKGARYWFLYWCPTWLVDVGGFNPATASALSAALDIGSIVSLLSLGPITTRSKCCRHPIPPLLCVCIATILCIPMVFLAMWAAKTQDVWIVAPVLFILGTLVVVYHPIVAGIAANEACEIDGRNTHGAVSGFINGFGSLGSVIICPAASCLADIHYSYGLTFIAGIFGFAAVFSFWAHRTLAKAKSEKKRRLQINS